jgi:hypothetical protein
MSRSSASNRPHPTNRHCPAPSASKIDTGEIRRWHHRFCNFHYEHDRIIHGIAMAVANHSQAHLRYVLLSAGGAARLSPKSEFRGIKEHA